MARTAGAKAFSIPIGRTSSGEALALDIPRLIDTRMLIQGNSGAGKSWLLRLLAEQAGGRVQTIILDPEGEYATLREKLDMVLVGRDGEVPAEPRGAGLLARKLMELHVSSVIDLYDLRLPQRRQYVREFLESLLTLPRALWRPVLVAIDEAHLFCPERAAGESEATDAVVALMSQGRKRAICGVLLTQRLAKLHKDAAAEANNVVIGRTVLDVDQKRAGDLLGMGGNARQRLRDLKDGEFLGFGRAMSIQGVVRFVSDPVETTHPKAGQRHTLEAPQPSAVIRQVLGQLKDLTQQAEVEIRSLEQARGRIRDLERQVQARSAPEDTELRTRMADLERALAVAKGRVQAGPPKAEKVPLLTSADKRQLTSLVSKVAKVEGMVRSVQKVGERLAPLVEAIGQGSQRLARALDKADRTEHVERAQPRPSPARPLPTSMPVRSARVARAAAAPSATSSNGLTRMENVMLTALAQHPRGLTKAQVLVHSGYASSGPVSKAFAALARNGWTSHEGSSLRITAAGLDALGPFTPLPVGAALREHVLGETSTMVGAILRVLFEVYPESITKGEILSRTGYRSSGPVSKAFARLVRLAYAKATGPSRLRAADEFFEQQR